MNLLRWAIAWSAIFCFISAGCDKQEVVKQPSGALNQDDGHDHGDGHDHADDSHDDHQDVHGPKGGHPVKFDSDEYQAEWLHYNDNDVVRVVVYGPDGKTEAAVKADRVTIKRITDGTIFELDPEEPGADGATAVYSLDNKELSIAMNTGVSLELKIGDKTLNAEIKPQKPHKH